MSDSSVIEKLHRKSWPEKILNFGVSFLDEAFRGILPNDLIIIGAPSGVGKTQLCMNIAIANANQNKKVYYFALEARKFELEQRAKFQQFARFYFDDPDRTRVEGHLNYKDWLLQRFDKELEKYSDAVRDAMTNVLDNVSVFYKTGDAFTHIDLIEKVLTVQRDADLIIVDHLHYFDWDGENENKAIKEIIKTVRTLSLELDKPIILVSHLRKRDKRFANEYAADQDEFHGSSEIFKIATGAITLGSRGIVEGKFVSYLRIPKSRDDGSITRYLGEIYFDPKIGSYADEYRIGSVNQKESDFTPLTDFEIPYWAKSARRGNSVEISQEPKRFVAPPRVPRDFHSSYNPSRD